MSSFEWMELQTLTSEIAAARSRLAAARSSRDLGRVRALEEEITAAEGRRDKLLAYISTNLATDAEAGARVAAAKAAAAAEKKTASARTADEPDAPAAAEAATEEPEPEAPESVPVAQPAAAKPQTVDPITATAVASPGPTPTADSVEGGIMAWDQLTPSDIERAKHDIGVRRAEMLARHAEELKTLEADQAQLDVLEQAIDAFAKKFAKAAVVKLDEERELRQQGGN